MRSYVTAIGRQLSIEFTDGEPVVLSGLADVATACKGEKATEP
jgi:hypothetical protein